MANKATKNMIDQKKVAPEPQSEEKRANLPQIEPLMLSEPLLRSPEGVRFLRAEWLIALLPLCLWSYFLFGIYAIAAELLSVVCCMGGDLLIRFLRRRKDRTVARWEMTPIVTGLFIAFLLPPDAPLWVFGLAALLAACVGQLFGSMSACPISLPLLTVCLMRMLFPTATAMALRFDSENGRTVADLLRAGEKPNAEIVDLLLGRTDAMIGEVASLLILLAAAYLIIRKQISWHLPLAWLIGGALVAYMTAPETMSVYYYTGAQLLTGGFILVGCLIAPSRTTAPVTMRAGLIVGFAGGALTILFRDWLGVDGAVLAGLLVSLPARSLDRLLAPLPFGGRKK